MVIRHQSPAGRWELAMRAPAPHLRRYVHGDYHGYVERTPAPLRRREYPGPMSALIFDLGPPLLVVDPADPRRASRHAGGFLAAIGEHPAITEHDGFMQGVQVNLTAIGARLLVGAPMSALADRVIALDDVLGRDGRFFPERLAEARGWDARFDLLDELLARRILGGDAAIATRPVSWALAQLEASGGLVDVRALARELGYSSKHLITLFRDRVGLRPKQVARLVRFHRVMTAVRRGDAGTGTGTGTGAWSDLALACGFYDQAHLIRDVRHFSGLTPTELARTLADDPGAAVFGQVNSVQADAAGAA